MKLIMRLRKFHIICIIIFLTAVRTNIFALPPLADFSVNNTTPVVGQTITFTDASLFANTWSWNFGSGASPGTATTVGPHNVSYSTEGLKTVSLYETNGNGNDTETKTDYINVGLTPTAGVIGNSQYVCYNGDPPVISNVTSGTGSGTITYRWEYSESPFTTWTVISGATSSTHDPPSGLTSTRRYRRTTISTYYGVVRESTPAAYVTMTVETTPTAPTSVSSDRTGFCWNDAGNISLSATGGAGRTLRWFTGSCGGTDIGTGTPLSIPSPTTTTTYYARWENSCGNTSCLSTMVTVHEINAFVARIGDEYVCPGFISPPFNPESGNYNIGATQVQFSVERQNSSANWSFDWEIDETDIEVNSYSPNNATGSYSGSGSPVNLTFYITNVANTQQVVNFIVTNVMDIVNSCSEENTADNSALISILPMPAVGEFE